MGQEGLDFSSAETTSSVGVYPPGWMVVAVMASIIALLALVALSTWGAMRLGRGKSVRTSIGLEELPPSLKLLIALTLLGLLMVQAVAAIDVYVQTQIVHGSTLEYFQYLSWARLLGTSHAHLFGYAVLYGLISLFVSFTSAKEHTKCVLIAVILWSGIFDVLSWWGIKQFSPRFEWLSMTTGMATSAASIMALVLVVRSLWPRDRGTT